MVDSTWAYTELQVLHRVLKKLGLPTNPDELLCELTRKLTPSGSSTDLDMDNMQARVAFMEMLAEENLDDLQLAKVRARQAFTAIVAKGDQEMNPGAFVPVSTPTLDNVRGRTSTGHVERSFATPSPFYETSFQFQHFMLKPVRLRDGGSTIQISNIVFRCEGATVLPSCASCDNSVCTDTQGPMKAIDGRTDTSWVCHGMPALFVSFAERTRIHEFNLMKSTVSSYGGEPVQWSLSARNDEDTDWTRLHTQRVDCHWQDISTGWLQISDDNVRARAMTEKVFKKYGKDGAIPKSVLSRVLSKLPGTDSNVVAKIVGDIADKKGDGTIDVTEFLDIAFDSSLPVTG